MVLTRVAATSEIEAGAGLRVDVAGHRIALFRLNDDIVAIGGRCSHAEASLADGEVFDGAVECPRHGSEFDLQTGEPGSFPATKPVPVYDVTIDGSDVLLDLEPVEEEE